MSTNTLSLKHKIHTYMQKKISHMMFNGIRCETPLRAPENSDSIGIPNTFKEGREHLRLVVATTPENLPGVTLRRNTLENLRSDEDL